jgi:4-amino-4-deoxy-L-arabinose transferase-like glycosyltransferase
MYSAAEQAVTSRREIIAITSIIVIGGLLRVYRIDALPLWLDEAFTYYASSLPISDLASFKADLHPPIFYLIEKCILFFGRTEFILRIGPAVLGTASISVVYLLSRQFVNPLAGLVSAALLATSSTHIEYSQEARDYTLLFLALAVASYGLIGYLSGSATDDSSVDRNVRSTSLDNKPQTGRRWLIIYFFGSLAALYTHNISAYYLLFFNLIALICFWPLRLIGNRSFGRWTMWNVVLAVLWLPWLLSIIGRVDAFGWLPQVSGRDAFSTLVSVQGFGHLKGLKLLLNSLVFLCAFYGAVIAYRAQQRVLAVFVIATMALAPLCIWLSGYIKPVFMTRTILFTATASCLGLGILAAELRPRRVALSIISLILLLNCVSVFLYHKNHKKQDWRGLAEYIETMSNKGDAVIFCAIYMYLPYGYYHAGDVSNAYGWYGAEHAFMRMALSGTMTYIQASEPVALGDFSGRARSLWVVKAHCPDSDWAALENKLAAANWRPTKSGQFNGITLLQYRPNP